MSETDYLNQIQQLVELQKVDDEIHEEEMKLASAPAEIDDLKQRFESLEGRRNIALDKQAHLENQKKRLSNEIDDDSARIKKSKNKMMQVGNAREYNAIIREMDNMERSNRTREEERLTLMEALEDHNENLEAIDAEYIELKARLEAKKASLETTMAESRDKLAALANKRKHFSADIPRPIFSRYEFIRNRLEHPVIVGVEDGICSGCHIAVPPQTFIELQTGQQILNCPNCQRLIFWNEEYGIDAPAKKQRKAASGEEDEDSEVFFENRLKQARRQKSGFSEHEEDIAIELSPEDDLEENLSDLDADGDDSEI